MAEGRRRRRVGVVVRRNVDGLERSDRAVLRGGDALLEGRHFGRQVGLVADRRRHPAEQGRDFGAGLGEAEDVVDEEQDVAAFHVAEVLGHRQAGQPDPQARAGRLVHLAEDEGRLGDDARVGHLLDEVVALARPLAHAAEDRVARVLLGDVADQLLDDDRLADAGAAEDPDLAALGKWADQVDDLDARLEDLGLGRLLVESRSGAMDRQALGDRHRSLLIDRFAQDVEDTAECGFADRHHDRGAGVDRLDAARQPVGRGHGDAADPVVAQVLLDLAHDLRRRRHA